MHFEGGQLVKGHPTGGQGIGGGTGMAREVFGSQVYQDVMVANVAIVVPVDEIGHTQYVASPDAHAALFVNLAFHAIAYALAQVEAPARDAPTSTTGLFAALNHQHTIVLDYNPRHTNEGDGGIFSFHMRGSIHVFPAGVKVSLKKSRGLYIAGQAGRRKGRGYVNRRRSWQARPARLRVEGG
jgi:hypothetical protein